MTTNEKIEKKTVEVQAPKRLNINVFTQLKKKNVLASEAKA